MAEFPIIKMVEIDGMQVPFAYPQHETENEGYQETGAENPLPVYDKPVKESVDGLKTAIEGINIPDNKEVSIANLPETQNVKDVDVKAELALIKQQNIDLNNKLDSVIKEGRLQSDARLTGSNAEYFGATITQRPTIQEVETGDVYIAVDTQDAWQSNGTDWIDA